MGEWGMGMFDDLNHRMAAVRLAWVAFVVAVDGEWGKPRPWSLPHRKRVYAQRVWDARAVYLRALRMVPDMTPMDAEWA